MSPKPQPPVELTSTQKRLRVSLFIFAFVLFSIVLVGLFWLSSTPGTTVSLTLAYAAGLSMIFLPCTLPLVFVIVPLSTGHGYKKGLAIAALFGLGLTTTITIYGIVIALAGKLLGLDQATRVMFIIAGLAAFIFGLVELKLFGFNIPGLSVTLPSWIERRKEYAKSFFMGVFLGNAGIGCPNPAFYVLLAYIATTGSALTGGYLGFVHGIGRATPLILISLLAILGINSSAWFVKKKDIINRVMGWMLVLVGAFILLNGVYGHEFYEDTFFHTGLNDLWMRWGGGRLAETADVLSVETETKGFSLLASFLGRPPTMEEIQRYGMATFYALLFIPVIWYTVKWLKARHGPSRRP